MRSAVVALLLAVLSAPIMAAERPDLADVRRLLEIAPRRDMASPHREALDRYIAEQFRATGFESGEIVFPTVAFEPGEASLQLPDGSTVPLLAMSPNSAYPGNLPGGAWSGRLVDLGDGGPVAMQGASPSDAAVLLDMTSGRAWVTALELGAQVLIFAGSPRETQHEAMLKVCGTPLAVPRFYLRDEDAARVRTSLAPSASLGQTRVRDFRLTQTRPNRWKHVEAVNNWVVIPGGKLADKVVHIQAYKDANSIVPALAPGAEGACSMALMLRLLEHYKTHKPQCTLVFSAVSDHCNALRGEQFFLASAHPESGVMGDEMKRRQDELNEATFYEKIYAGRSPELIARLRDGTEKYEGVTYILKNPLWREMEYRRNRTLHAVAVAQDSLKRPDLSEADIAALHAEIETLQAKRADLIAVMSVLQRWGGKSNFEDLSKEPQGQQQQLLSLLTEMETRFREQREDAQTDLDQIKANSRLNDLLAGKTPHLYLTLDLSFGNRLMGFFFAGSVERSPNTWHNSVKPLARLSVGLAKGMPGGKDYFADTLSNVRGIPWQAYLPGLLPLASSVGSSQVIPSVTLATIYDPREAAYTPRDTLERIDEASAEQMLSFAERFLPEMLEHPNFGQAVSHPGRRNFDAMTIRYRLRRLDPYSVERPIEPVPDAMVLMHPRWTVPAMVAGQVNILQRTLTGRQGAALYRGIPTPPYLEAYGFSPDHARIDRALDAGSSQRRYSSEIKPAGDIWKWDDHFGLMFDCVQTDLVGSFDPDTRNAIGQIILLDALRESSPDHYGFAGVQELRSKFKARLSPEGIVSLFTEPQMPMKIISDGYLLINATSAAPTGTGYLPGSPELRRISDTSTKDIQTLNAQRLGRLEEKAVSNRGAQELYRRAADLQEQAAGEQSSGHQAAFLSKSIQALSNSLRSYNMVRTTYSDLIRAVAVFLALVVPFCMFLMKLINPWTDVRAQIGVFLGLFALMATGLMYLHPAFGLSQTPMMSLLAFAMVGLAVFVMLILYGRFDAGMQDMVAQMEGVERSESSRKTLAGVAFNVGVNNMRRRRIRTSLTAATIVLVTFTMLSVISVGQSLSPYRRKTDNAVPYNGVLYAKPGMQPITFSTEYHISGLLSGFGKVVRRTWTERIPKFGDYLPMEVRLPGHPEKALRLLSLLGLEPEEDGLLAPMPLVAGRWISGNDAPEILLSVGAARAIDIDPASFQPTALEFFDRRVTLVGLLDDDKLAAMTDMVKLPLLPLAYQANSQDMASVMSVETAATTPAPGAQSLPTAYCAIVPAGFAMKLPSTSIRSIALKASSPTQAWAAARHLADVTGQVTYAAFEESVKVDDTTTLSAGQYSFGPPGGASVGGAGKVIIPICLAATIILNTMLGSVMERRKEIAVYNSIGLNPTHVFVFFVAEAVVFGLIGSVAGYLIGQALAQVIVHAGLLPGVNLNFSSMAVILVIFAAMFTVVVSTMYPAYVATRAAVPSGQRRWKLPTPAGDEFWLDFPFSYSQEQLPGVFAYLQAFMDMNSEASSGKFLAQDARAGYVPDVDGRKAMALTYQIAPVPFDLGVNQRLELYGHYEARVKACVISACVTRLKGDRNSWLTVNQGFMESLRARLLSWRSQPNAIQEQFRMKGQEMFGAAGDLPVKGAAS